MTNEERREIDRACLELLSVAPNEDRPCALFEVIRDEDGYTLKSRPLSPSQDPALVVPLAEALDKAGYNVNMDIRCGRWDVRVSKMQHRGAFAIEDGSSLSACIAAAAARAMERSEERK